MLCIAIRYCVTFRNRLQNSLVIVEYTEILVSVCTTGLLQLFVVNTCTHKLQISKLGGVTLHKIQPAVFRNEDLNFL